MGIRLALILVLLAIAMPGRAAEAQVSAMMRIKAAFLYKFAAYVAWPPTTFADAQSPITIGVAGAEAIAQELEGALAGRTAGGRPVRVRKLARGESPEACCHILFIGQDAGGQADEILSQVQGRPVLTVTDAEKEHPKGSVINFAAADDRVRFDISRGAAQRNGIQLGSRLLTVARRIE